MKQVGDYGEAVAEGYLAAKGYAILAKNVKRGAGEVDLIARAGDTVVFVEVKYRRGFSFGEPAAAVGYAKRRRVCAAALAWIGETGTDANFRFDVIELFGKETIEANHIIGAFDYIE